jgi:hypothetical protein
LGTDKFLGSAFADELTIFSRDNDELLKVLGLIQEFWEAAGLLINTDKSEILELGDYKYSKDALLRNGQNGRNQGCMVL